MPNADLDTSDFTSFMDKRGRNPRAFELVASPADPSEGALAPSRRTVTVRHTPTGAARDYAFRTWLADFAVDLEAGVFGAK